MKKETVLQLKGQAAEYYKKAGIMITSEEREKIEVADFGLHDVYVIGPRQKYRQRFLKMAKNILPCFMRLYCPRGSSTHCCRV